VDIESFEDNFLVLKLSFKSEKTGDKILKDLSLFITSYPIPLCK